MTIFLNVQDVIKISRALFMESIMDLIVNSVDYVGKFILRLFNYKDVSQSIEIIVGIVFITIIVMIIVFANIVISEI